VGKEGSLNIHAAQLTNARAGLVGVFGEVWNEVHQFPADVERCITVTTVELPGSRTEMWPAV
jgi:hypothetical protein